MKESDETIKINCSKKSEQRKREKEASATKILINLRSVSKDTKKEILIEASSQ
jgi:hypothetical protein